MDGNPEQHQQHNVAANIDDEEAINITVRLVDGNVVPMMVSNKLISSPNILLTQCTVILLEGGSIDAIISNISSCCRSLRGRTYCSSIVLRGKKTHGQKWYC